MPRLLRTWASSQYPKTRLSVRSRKVSKPRDLYLELSDRSEIWQALRQQCCRCVCQISKRYDNFRFHTPSPDQNHDLSMLEKQALVLMGKTLKYLHHLGLRNAKCFLYLISDNNSAHTGSVPVFWMHYCDVIMSEIASQITSFTIVCSTVCSVADQRKHQSYASLAFVRGIHRRQMNSPHKGPVTRKMFPFDDVIMWIFNIIKTPTAYWTHLPPGQNGCHFADDIFKRIFMKEKSYMLIWISPNLFQIYYDYHNIYMYIFQLRYISNTK